MANDREELNEAIEVEALSNDCSVVNIKDMVSKDKSQQMPETVANELEMLTEDQE